MYYVGKFYMELSMRNFSAIEHMQELRKANFTEEQAEAVIKIIEQQAYIIHEQSTKLLALENKDPATKSDLLQVESRLESKLELKIEQLRTELIRWVLGTGFCGILAMIGILKYMIH